MATITEPKSVAEAQRKLRTLRARVAGRRPNTKIEVDAGTLQSILMVIDAVTPKPTRRPAAPQRAPLAERKVIDEISPQEAADILQMSRPSVMRLIQKGFLHPRKVLSRNKLSRAEVLAYQAEHAREQREALANLTALSDEYDF
jgi:hypothetical protein